MLLAITIFKFVKGTALLALTFGAFSMFHKDVADHVERWLDMVRVDPDNRYVGALLTQLHLVHTKELKDRLRRLKNCECQNQKRRRTKGSST